MQSSNSNREKDVRAFGGLSHGWAVARGESGPRCLHHFFERTVDASPGAVALVCEGKSFTYARLDALANQLAHHLLRLGICPGDCVGLLLERSLATYVALLAALKCGAAFVPLDTSFPADRLEFIAEDASLAILITTRSFEPATRGVACPLLFVDAAPDIEVEPEQRPNIMPASDALCYIIYTSGTTGRPKGVAVTQASIRNFLCACMPIYGVTRTDRVYQGMTLAFDFSIEEIWPTFAAGATLVAGPSGHRRLGAGLTDFLIEQEITVMACVPTLLATIERDVPTLRTLLVGGEACPAALVERWSRPGRRMLNTYGPTEATVTATWTELRPGKAVTIGRPLPSYTVHILDEQLQEVAAGTSGEICIGGPSVAVGYVNRPELTAERFVQDPFNDRPGARLYRTGDLGRLTPDEEIEYLGRIDSQVKIRGYRIELGEIEAVLREDVDVVSAIVALVNGEANVQELAAYVVLAGSVTGDLRQRLQQNLRRRLPQYMVPAFIEIMDSLPMLPSGKADRSRLPAPVSNRLAADAVAPAIAPETPLEKVLLAAWARVFGLTNPSVDADFFLDLGGHSLFAAMVISDLRKDPALMHLAMADLYTHPTIRGLASFLASHPAHVSAHVPGDRLRHGNARVLACGLAQTVGIYLMMVLVSAPLALLLTGTQRNGAADWLWAGLGAVGIMVVTRLALPVLGKWLLLGRTRPGRYPLWGWYYCRWWLARKLMALAPLGTLAGSPLLAPYVRLFGARIGRGCHLASSRLLMPDLLEIGAGTSIGYAAVLEPFLVEDGWLYLAPIRLGEGCFIGTNAVVMLGANVGDGACLGEQSLVARSQTIPAGETWAGSPSRRVADDSQLKAMADGGAGQQWSVVLGLGFVAGFLMMAILPWLNITPGLILLYLLADGDAWQAVAALPIAGLIYVLTTCLLVAVGKKLAMPRTRLGLVPLCSFFGLRKWVADKLMQLSLGATNSLYATLYTSPWLRLLGATVGKRAEVSTVSDIDPDLVVMGQECFIADLAVVGAARYHRGMIALGKTELGARCFVGNAALVPSDTRLPGGSLIGVQSVPPREPIKEGTSWLGSPAIFLPRRQMSEQFDDSVTYHPSARLVICRLAVESLRVVLPASFAYLVMLAGLMALPWFTGLPAWSLAFVLPGFSLGMGLVVTILVALCKWVVVGRYRPRVEPMWSFFVWRTELITALYENVAVPWLLRAFTGTPLLAPLLRLFGARIGRRVYMETTFLTEFDLVHVGADAMIAGVTSLQTHLFEDRVMKMSTVKVGQGCSIGPRSVVLYDAELADNANLEALSLAMKGELLPADTRWRGIPAQMIE